jgi:hypothetical protein
MSLNNLTQKSKLQLPFLGLLRTLHTLQWQIRPFGYFEALFRGADLARKLHIQGLRHKHRR